MVGRSFWRLEEAARRRHTSCGCCLHSHLQAQLQFHRGRKAVAAATPATASTVSHEKHYVVIGAGLAGLATAYHLLVRRASAVGTGWAKPRTALRHCVSGVDRLASVCVVLPTETHTYACCLLLPCIHTCRSNPQYRRQCVSQCMMLSALVLVALARQPACCTHLHRQER